MVSAHCENCGRPIDPYMTGGDVEDGYTRCCNELVCYGNQRHTFGTQDENVRACCWARAQEKFGGWDKVPEGSYRLS